MALTETWLNETDGDNYNIKGYNFLQRKRKHKNGGGIALYIKEDIKVKIRNYINDENNTESIESLFVEIQNPKGKNIIIGVVYRTILLTRLQLLCGQSSASGGRRLSFLARNLLWPCSLIETSDRVKWDSLIAKGFIFEVSSQALKRREAEKMEITINLHASHVCWPVSYRFFIASVYSIET